MSEDQPNPQANAPEAKKETACINLPPKPTAAPTVKIPAPSAVAGAKPAAAAPAAAGGAAGATQKLPSAAPKAAASAPPAPAASVTAKPSPVMAPRPAVQQASGWIRFGYCSHDRGLRCWSFRVVLDSTFTLATTIHGKFDRFLL